MGPGTCIFPLVTDKRSWNSVLQSAGLLIERLRVRIPAGAAGEFSSSELTFCA